MVMELEHWSLRALCCMRAGTSGMPGREDKVIACVIIDFDP
jgi:hypothetical protein